MVRSEEERPAETKEGSSFVRRCRSPVVMGTLVDAARRSSFWTGQGLAPSSGRRGGIGAGEAEQWRGHCR